MKNIKNFISTLLITSFLSTSFLMANQKEPDLLTFDKTKNNEESFESSMPRNFRDLNNPEDKININAIASAQFNEDELKAIKKKYPNQKILIIDLRKESHAFINDKPISWRSQFNLDNKEKQYQQILSEEKQKVNDLKKKSQIIVSEIIKKDEKNGWFSEISPIIVNVNKVETESEIAKRNGFDYKRIAIRDHSYPNKKQLTEIVSLIEKTSPKTKIYVHCAAGRGRTTTFLTIFDIIKNGKDTTLEEIFKRQYKIGGSRLDKIDEDSKWREDLAKERLETIKSFYEKYTEKSISKKSTNSVKNKELDSKNIQNESKKLENTIEETTLKDVSNDDFLENSSPNKIKN
ncbi:MAG: hypothetical protein LW595_04310 [Rickettsiales bacterium]|nr:hypothetical protein [Rickettsiales bacterium]